MVLSKEARNETAGGATGGITSPDVNPAAFTSSSPASSSTEKGSPDTQRELGHEPSPSRVVHTQIATPPPTPPHNPSTLSPTYGRFAKTTKWSNLTILKSVLLPEERKCGALKVNGEPCRAWMPSEGRKQVDTQIRAIVASTQSSPELEAELQKLVMLVHCRYHNYGKYNASRIEGWTTMFPPGETKDMFVESAEKRIKKALGELKVQCAWEVAPGEPCRELIGGQRVQNCTKTINKIVEPAVYTDDTWVEGYLNVLLANMYCDEHVNGRPLGKVATWKREIMEIRKQANETSAQHLSIRVSNEFGDQSPASPIQRDTKNLVKDDVNLIPQNQCPPTPSSPRAVSLDFTMDPTKFWPTAYDVAPFVQIPWIGGCKNNETSRRLVEKEMERQLSIREEGKCGYVYLYEVEGNPGFVKIGYTSRQLQKRYEEWTFGCNRKTKPLYPMPSGTIKIIPNAHRVELLCHAELDHCRTRIDCSACLKPHIEWFKVSPEEAIKVIENWTKWISTATYNKRTLRSDTRRFHEEQERRGSTNVGQFKEEVLTTAETIVA